MYDVLENIPGKDLEGMTYQPLFPYYADRKCGEIGAFRVLCDSYVTSGDGTGIVHQVRFCFGLVYLTQPTVVILLCTLLCLKLTSLTLRSLFHHLYLLFIYLQAPGFGEDDYRVCMAAGVISKGIDVPCPVDSSGLFTSPITDFTGRYIKETDQDICAALKTNGLLIHKVGCYPHIPTHLMCFDLLYLLLPVFNLLSISLLSLGNVTSGVFCAQLPILLAQ